MAIDVLPQNGRIIVVDDQIDEALPLITLLSRSGIPVTYFTGNPEELPSHPNKDIRVIFMDLRLTVGKIEDKNVISNFIAVFRRLISSENGPFILILWSKHDADYLEQLKEIFKNELCDIQPTILFNMEKSSYLISNSDGTLNYSLDDIESRLKSELNNIGILEVIILWENLIQKSASETISELTSLCNKDSNWIEKFGSVLKTLAISRLGKNIHNGTPQDILNSGLYAFNDAFLDYLERNISAYDFGHVNMDIAATSDLEDVEIKAKLNSKLLLRPIQYSNMPGSLYKYDKDNREEKMLFFEKFKTFVHDCLNIEVIMIYVATRLGLEPEQLYNEKGKLKTESKKGKSEFVDSLVNIVIPILLEVSPECDFAQKKWTVHRLLPGLAFPWDYFQCVKKSDYLVPIEPLEINNEVYGVVFDLRYMTSLPLDEFEKMSDIEHLCVFRRETVSHIQTLLARHIGRIGLASL